MLGLVAAAIGCASPEDGTTEFNASVWFADTFPLTRVGYLDWSEKLYEATGGELRPKVFTGTALLPPAGHLTGIRDGIVQLGFHAGTYTPSELPEDNVLAQLSLGYTDYFPALFAMTEMNLNDGELQAQWLANGIVYGGSYTTPPYRLFCTSPVVGVGDLEGKKIRTPGGAHSDWAKSVGAVPVNVASSEMYTGLEKGQVDCAVNSANDLKTRSLWDVAKHTTMIELGIYWSGFLYGFNQEFWNGLTPAHRRIFFDTFADAVVATGMEYLRLAEEAIEEAPSHGVTIHEPDEALKKSILDFVPVARENAIRLGRDSFDLDDPAGLIERVEAAIEKWSVRLSGADRTDAAALAEILRTEIYDRVDVTRYGVEEGVAHSMKDGR